MVTHLQVRRLALKALAALLLVLSLGGCLYPDEQRKENQASVRESILLVQNAVDTYKQRTGVLPIKNSAADTPLYEKYVIDMRKLKEGQYLSQIPGIAFENGGSAMFVLVNPESKPEVKIMDLAAYQLTGDIQKWVDEYKAAHGGEPPKGEAVASHFYVLDFGKMGKKMQQAESRYSRQYLTFVVHESGTVAIDYAPEIMKAMTQQGMTSADPGTDLRSILVNGSPYVPVKSYPYHWINNQPTLSEK